ncbi:DinB family protein [Flagellimonas crocea]|uniref:DinB family protein n=1 Tax=Flagellimonas crocea TaxID=3067311 RepID=UPI00296FA0A4|nr:DinB family protein [Muricauda sp. DH64]
MFKSSLDILEQFKQVLCALSKNHYSQPCTILSDVSIGQHTRHVIELYLCLIQGYDEAVISYDRRARDPRIEEDLLFALEQLDHIQKHLEKPNKPINLIYELCGEENSMESNYHREVMYNLEHAIHHQALIKIGINHFSDIDLPESFGVAPSTIQYRNQCAQ